MIAAQRGPAAAGNRPSSPGIRRRPPALPAALLAWAALLWAALGWAWSPPADAAVDVALVINGSPVRADVPPRIISGRTLVPIRIVSENLGARVDWDPADRSVAIQRGQRRVHLTVGEPEAYIDQQAVTLDVPPVILDGRTMVPLRFVGEALGAHVDWDEASRTVTVMPRQHMLTGVSVHPDPDRGRVRLHLSGAVDVRVTAVEGRDGGARIFVDLPGTEALLARPEFPVGLAGVARGRVEPHPNDEGTLRVILELEQPMPYQVSSSGDGREVVLEFPYQVTGIHHARESGVHQVFIETNGPVEPQVSTLPDPPRIVVDLPGTTAGPRLSSRVDVGRGVIQRIRAAQHDRDVVRVVLDLTEAAGYSVQAMPGGVLVTVRGAGGQEDPQEPAQSPARPLAGRTIIVDAGHGGKDPGARSASGIYEKHIVLDLARRTAQVLEEAGARVVMIRSDDRFIDLYERAAMANSAGGDAFISIHANAYQNASLQGTETYYHVTDPQGKRLAELLHREMLKALGLPDRRLDSADFVVLRETRMPAALVEAAYITNPAGERLLTSAEGREAVAQAILRALIAFFN